MNSRVSRTNVILYKDNKITGLEKHRHSSTIQFFKVYMEFELLNVIILNPLFRPNKH